MQNRLRLFGGIRIKLAEITPTITLIKEVILDARLAFEIT